jgi:hypothetical protein
MNHHPTRFQIRAFEKALREAQTAPEFNDEHLRFLAQRRDAFLAKLNNR